MTRRGAFSPASVPANTLDHGSSALSDPRNCRPKFLSGFFNHLCTCLVIINDTQPGLRSTKATPRGASVSSLENMIVEFHDAFSLLHGISVMLAKVLIGSVFLPSSRYSSIRAS